MVAISVNASRYTSTRSNSTTAAAGASDHSADASVQQHSSASAPATTAAGTLHPASGRSDTVIRSRIASASTTPASATAPGKKPPALKAR
jgi:hypothetical protein